MEQPVVVGGSGRGSRGTRSSGRKRGNRRATGSTEEQESLVSAPASPGNKDADLSNLEDGVEERPMKRARARGMNAQKKLFLIGECCFWCITQSQTVYQSRTKLTYN